MQTKQARHIHTDAHTYAIGKARVSGVSQGRLRLRALIDCNYSVYVPWPHLSVCQRVRCGAGRWKWQHWEWFCHPSLKRKVRCAMLVIHQDIDSKKGREVEMQQEKTSELLVSQFVWRWSRLTQMNILIIKSALVVLCGISFKILVCPAAIKVIFQSTLIWDCFVKLLFARPRMNFHAKLLSSYWALHDNLANSICWWR